MKRPWWTLAAFMIWRTCSWEKIWKEYQLLHGRQRVLRNKGTRVVAAAIEAELPDNPELVGHGDGLTSGNTDAPLGNRLLEKNLAVLAPAALHKVDETIEVELGACVNEPHRPLEAQELLRIFRELSCCDDSHLGTGKDTSRRVSVAILT